MKIEDCHINQEVFVVENNGIKSVVTTCIIIALQKEWVIVDGIDGCTTKNWSVAPEFVFSDLKDAKTKLISVYNERNLILKRDMYKIVLERNKLDDLVALAMESLR